MWARVSTIAGSAEGLDDGTAMVNDQIIPRAKELPGFAGAIFLADRASGKLVAVTLWDSEESLRASEEAADKLRADAADQARGSIASVERFEVIAQV